MRDQVVMAMRFSAATAIVKSGEGTWDTEVPPGWSQGKGSFGGLVLGVLGRAMEAELGDPARPMRTLSGDILAGVQPGPTTIRVRRLRHAGNQTNSIAELVQGGEVVAVATGLFSKPRVSPTVSLRAEPPPPLDWSALEVLPVFPPVAPVFAQHVAFRTAGALPFMGAESPSVEGFVEFREREASHDVAAIIGLLDCWWPGFLVTEPGPRLSVTVSFLAEFLVDPATVPVDAPLRYRARTLAEGGGFVVEFRELWSGDRLVAANQQAFAVVK